MISFRRTEPSDLLTLSEWIAADAYHREKLTASFFMETGKGISCYTVEDEEGPVAFLRQEEEGENVRLHAQFPEGRKRLAAAVTEGFPLIMEDARQRRYKQMRFELESPALIKIMLRFGFRADLIADL